MKRNHFIDILKGVCSLFIIVTHFAFKGSQRLQLLFPFWVDMAVPIFMMLSGYVTMASMRKKNVQTIEEAYELKTVITKLIRFTVPFFLIWLVEFGFVVYDNGILNVPLSYHLTYFAQGGEGPGAYYYPIMMQFVFVFPLIYFLIERTGFAGLVVLFFTNYLLEFLKGVYQLSENTYCLLLFRYIFIIGVGAYLASSHYRRRTSVLLLSFVVGVVFLIATQYWGFHFPYLGMWTATSMMGCLYVAAVISVGLRRCSAWRFEPLEVLGRASYNIFLVQKAYYLRWLRFDNIIWGHKINLWFSLVFCVAVGVLFYYIEQPITKWVTKKIVGIIERHPLKDAWL